MPDIQKLNDTHFSAWSKLYASYGQFYHISIDGPHQQLVWQWIRDDQKDFHALGAFQSNQLVGIAHYRTFLHSLKGGPSLFLDDLFVEPSYRTQGIASALLEAIYVEGRKRGCKLVRWLTSPTNTIANAFYASHAQQTDWTIYDHPLT